METGGDCAPVLDSMNKIWIWLLVSLFVTGGCVSKARHKLEVREAYVAGQEQALAAMSGGGRPGNPVSKTDIFVHGHVKNTIIPWEEGMTVGQAIVAAEYIDSRDPRMIVLHRGGETMQINPKELLRGRDFPARAGDVIELQP